MPSLCIRIRFLFPCLFPRLHNVENVEDNYFMSLPKTVPYYGHMHLWLPDNNSIINLNIITVYSHKNIPFSYEKP